MKYFKVVKGIEVICNACGGVVFAIRVPTEAAADFEEEAHAVIVHRRECRAAEPEAST